MRLKLCPEITPLCLSELLVLGVFRLQGLLVVLKFHEEDEVRLDLDSQSNPTGFKGSKSRKVALSVFSPLLIRKLEIYS